MQRSDPPRYLTRLALVLALVAWTLRLAAPPGFMPATATGTGLAPWLVICDGQSDSSFAAHKAPVDGKLHVDHVCPFAAAANASPPPAQPLLAPPRALYAQAATSPAIRDLAPGLGLAAPPPPSQGPPELLV